MTKSVLSPDQFPGAHRAVSVPLHDGGYGREQPATNGQRRTGMVKDWTGQQGVKRPKVGASDITPKRAALAAKKGFGQMSGIGSRW